MYQDILVPNFIRQKLLKILEDGMLYAINSQVKISVLIYFRRWVNNKKRKAEEQIDKEKILKKKFN